MAAGRRRSTTPTLGRSVLIVRTAFAATYPPRLCGIAAFTSDLAMATGSREIAVLHSPDQPSSAYALEVHHRIRVDEPDDYARTARALADCVDVVSVQHEYGIWGGRDGRSVIDFVRALDVPAVTTLHTVLQHPTLGQKQILAELVTRSDATVVMSSAAANLLDTAYGVDPSRVHVIPHGVPDLPLIDSAIVKPRLGVQGREVILSFGLLGPGKGYELVLDALPEVVADHPDALYVIVGATHPDLVRRDGEAYRRGLEDQVRRLGLGEHVRFVDRFVGRNELTQWLEAADVFVTPYPNLDQIVSGTLSYAMGAGRAIVSSPYAYARELLADGRGLLVEPGSPASLSKALAAVLADDDLRARLGRRAYEHSREMVWSAVGGTYRRLFERIGARAPAGSRSSVMTAINA